MTVMQIGGYAGFGTGAATGSSLAGIVGWDAQQQGFVPLKAKTGGGASGPGAAFLVSSDGDTATYRTVLTDVAPAATPTDWIEIIGSATKTVRVKWIRMRGFSTTAGQLVAQLLKRSAVNTAGAVTALTPVPLDKNDAAATATINQVTANRTLGTLVGPVDSDDLELALAGAPGEDAVFDFCTHQDKAGILRGVADLLCVNFNGAALPAGTKLTVTIEHEEDLS